jgi:hypothetical protein
MEDKEWRNVGCFPDGLQSSEVPPVEMGNPDAHERKNGSDGGVPFPALEE